MTFKETKGLIRSDYYRLRESFSFHMFIKDLIFNSSFKTTFWLRIGNYLNSKRNIVVLSDVPDNVTVGGIPAKIISQNHN